MSLFEATSSFPLEKNSDKFEENLTPKLSFRFNPAHMKNLANRNVNVDNLFSINRLGVSEDYEEGKSLTIGLDYKKTDITNNAEDLNNDGKINEIEDIEKFFEIKLAGVLRDVEEDKISSSTTLNRTASNLRTIFQKAGGSLGTQGSASHNFKQLGIIKIDKNEISEDKIFELAIEAGAEECISHQEFHEVQCVSNEIYNVKKNLENTIANFISTEIEWVPINSVDIQNDEKESVIEFLENLEDDDDVQNVFSNVNLGSI